MDNSNAIICKYCRFFSHSNNCCYLYTQFDRILDNNRNAYTPFQSTLPNQRCSHFALSDFEAIAHGIETHRKDGSPIVDFDDCPNLKVELQRQETRPSSNSSGGCYIATCIYGSYNCPQVWTLRRFRDQILWKSFWGRLFIHTYYAISPIIVRVCGNSKLFVFFWRPQLDKMVQKLQKRGIDSTPYDDVAW